MTTPFTNVGDASGVDDEDARKLRAIQGAQLAQYQSQPIATLPAAQPFHPGAAFGGASAPQMAQMDQGPWKGLTSAVQSVGKGIKAYQANQAAQTQQGILGDPLGTGADGSAPMPPDFDPNKFKDLFGGGFGGFGGGDFSGLGGLF